MSYVNCPGILPLHWLGIRDAAQSVLLGTWGPVVWGCWQFCESSGACPKHRTPDAEVSSPAGVCQSHSSELRQEDIFFAAFISQMSLYAALLMHPVPTVL